jgi:hypothetical protein
MSFIDLPRELIFMVTEKDDFVDLVILSGCNDVKDFQC